MLNKSLLPIKITQILRHEGQARRLEKSLRIRRSLCLEPRPKDRMLHYESSFDGIFNQAFDSFKGRFQGFFAGSVVLGSLQWTL